MRYFDIVDADGPSRVRVPAGKDLADLGYTSDVIAAAVETTRPPGPHREWQGGRWVENTRARALKERESKARLGMLFDELEERQTALARDYEAMAARLATMEGQVATLKAALPQLHDKGVLGTKSVTAGGAA